MNIAVFGIYDSREATERAVHELKTSGFSSSDVSVLYSSMNDAGDVGVKNATKAPEGAATGAVSGATIGGVLGWLAGIGSLAIPGVGPLIAAGPIMAALAGASVGGTVGGLGGTLIGLGIPEYEAQKYQDRIEKGGILLSVHAETDEEIVRAKAILERTAAEDISTKSEVAGVKSSTATLDPRPLV